MNLSWYQDFWVLSLQTILLTVELLLSVYERILREQSSFVNYSTWNDSWINGITVLFLLVTAFFSTVRQLFFPPFPQQNLVLWFSLHFPEYSQIMVTFWLDLLLLWHLSNLFLLVLLLWCMKISPSLSLTASLRRTYCSRHAVENQLGKNEKSHLYMETVKLLNHRWVCITYLFKSLCQKLVCDLCEHRVTNSGFTSNMGWQT